ncbi:primosomal protein N' family protein, partial [Bordetella bronchiseptica D993]
MSRHQALAAVAAPPLQVDAWLNTPEPLELARLRGQVVVLHAFQMLCPGCLAHGLPQAERLFAQLMQVAGRAGRHAAGAQVLIQTGYPEQPVYQALLRHDYAGFARHALQEREDTGLPPFAYQAL